MRRHRRSYRGSLSTWVRTPWETRLVLLIAGVTLLRTLGGAIRALGCCSLDAGSSWFNEVDVL